MARAVVMIYAEEFSNLGGTTAPSYAAISQAFRTMDGPPRMKLVGPGPRVTRISQLPTAWLTKASQPMVVEVPDGPHTGPGSGIGGAAPTVDELIAEIPNALGVQLEALQPGTSWGAVQVSPYNERLNGPLSFWENGDATRTRTFDTAQSVVLPGTDENPVGPNDPNLRPQTTGELLQEGRNAAPNLLPYLIVGTVALGLIYLGPALAGLLGGSPGGVAPARRPRGR